MNNFARKLLTEWRKLDLPFEDQTLVVAVSGGADSLSLALALRELKERKKLNLRFVIAHFNHNLRGQESDEDEEFVKELAEKFNFELALKKENLTKEGNLEQNARTARYKFLTETAEILRAYGILTAHTLNDQSETFLMNLIRGSGLEGLGAMRSIRAQFLIENNLDIDEFTENETNITTENSSPPMKLIRPLLSWAKRAMTEKYCHDCGIEYRYDTMNEDLAFQRVRIRKILIPLLEDLNPKIIENLGKTAFLLQEDFAALEEVAKSKATDFEDLSGQNVEKSDLEIKKLKDLFPSMRRRILRSWLKRQRGDLRSLDSKHIEAIESLIFSRKSGKIVELPNKEFISKGNGRINFTKNVG